MSSEKRRHIRRSLNSDATLTWIKPGGMPVTEKARVLNFSSSGCLLQTKTKYPTRDLIHIRVAPYGINGKASVRYSDPRGIGYLTGLEFTGGVAWKDGKDCKDKAQPAETKT
jgi:hypothetical protein